MRVSYVRALKTFCEDGEVQSKLEPITLIGKLTARGVLTPDEADNILSKNTKLERQQELFLELIPKSNDSAFQTLLDILDNGNSCWARELLQRTHEKEIKENWGARLSQEQD